MKYLLGATALMLSAVAQAQSPFYLGADLSYVNEVEDCGAEFYAEGERKDPFVIFAEQGASIIRVRKWHNPTWTEYSDFDDVAKTISRAKASGMRVMLDLHYSDTWADPSRQEIPAAWAEITDQQVLANKVYQYTYDTLARLHALGLTPDMIQIGNETNSEILQPEGNTNTETINWQRNILLLNSGLKAVRNFSVTVDKSVQSILHIAQPENALVWFAEAHRQGIGSYDIIGLSYYAKWSEYDFDGLADALQTLENRYQKPVMIVETSYPWTLNNYDEADNVLGEDSLLPAFPATPQGQLEYLLTLTQSVKDAGGLGVVYWEPAWLSTPCKTLWGTGSHWENAGFFDMENNNDLLPAFKFFTADYCKAKEKKND